MFVLHAALTGDPDRLIAVWAEHSEATTTRRRAGRPPRELPHPFALAAPELRALCGTAGVLGTLSLALPSGPNAPAPSPELVSDHLDSMAAGSLELRSWPVPVLLLTAAECCSWSPPEAAVPGSTARHLLQLNDFVAELVSRGRVLPTVTDGSARWQPVLTGPDAAMARALAQATPRAAFAGGIATDPHPLAQVLERLVDARVRQGVRAADLRGRRLPAGMQKMVAALAGPAGLDLPSDDLDTLDLALREWQRDAIGGAVRACFRLVEPVGPQPQTIPPQRAEAPDTWSLTLSLQAADEPSLQINADTIWRSEGRLAGLAGELDSPQETFLAELGKAARLYPDLADALRTARPAELTLDTEGAHQFLSAGAPLLAASGFGVLLPSWWTAPAGKLGLRLKVSTPGQPGAVSGGSSAVGTAALTEYRFDLAVGGHHLTEQEMAELAALKAPLVRIRGQWMELDAKRLAAGLKMVGRTGTATVGEILRMGAGLVDIPGELPIVDIEADGWLQTALTDAGQVRLTPVAVPAGFTGTLRPYQQRGLDWLDFLSRAGLGGVLADDMGLGKTVQLLALLAGQARAAGPTLLVCPMSLVGNWQREAATFTPALRIHVHHGADRARGKHFQDAVAEHDVVLTTYALAARDAAALSKVGWAHIVLDEAQAIKNAATRQSTAIRSLPGGTRIAVTGTPVENRLADLWSIMDFVNPGILGTAAQFRDRYARPIERNGDDEAAERLRRLTSPFLLRRLKTDRTIIADLPDKMEMEVICNLTTEQASLYQAVLDDMMAKIEAAEGIERRGLVLATMTKLKQVCNHPAQFLKDASRLPGRSGKLERLEEITEEVLAAGDKALLFTQYAEFGNMLRGHLAGRFGREVLFLHGGVAKADRDRMVARFQAGGPGSPPLFILSLKAGGTGLTLTAANHVIHVDRWWNPAVEDQATDRAFRIGQRKSVQVRKFVCAGTLEEKIGEMITQKRGLAAKIVGSGEGWVTEMSTGQLRELFALEAGATVE